MPRDLRPFLARQQVFIQPWLEPVDGAKAVMTSRFWAVSSLAWQRKIRATMQYLRQFGSGLFYQKRGFKNLIESMG